MGRKQTRRRTKKLRTRKVPSKSHFKKHHCSPKERTLDFSCLPRKSLQQIAQALNRLHNLEIPYKQVEDTQLYSDICSAMKDNYNCNSEACWLKAHKLMNLLPSKEEKYIKEHFRSFMSDDIAKDTSNWLSNVDIDSMLKQHHKENKDVYYYEATPRDFHNCSVSHLCNLDIHKHLNRGETKLITVFNTDDSSGGGQHWIAYYVDLRGHNFEQPGIYFFDSFGSKPMKEVQDLTEKIKEQGKSTKSGNPIEFIVTHNPHSFQKNSFSCGFYCMHFLEHMISNLSFESYLNSGLNDEMMINYRNRCFIHPDEI